MNEYTVDALKARVAELEQAIRDIETWLALQEASGDDGLITLHDFPCETRPGKLAARSYWVIRQLMDGQWGTEDHSDGTTQDEDE